MYRTADVEISSITTSLETVQWAWRRIQHILEIWSDDKIRLGQEVDTETLDQLNRSLSGGRLVISALAEDLLPSTPAQGSPKKSGFKRELKVVWNEQALRAHQERIRDQVNSMNLLISVLQIPNPALRRQTLRENSNVLRKSNRSVCSITPSRLSILSVPVKSHRHGSLHSPQSETSLQYQKLNVDNELFTAEVYKRNYRNKLFRRLQQISSAAAENSSHESQHDPSHIVLVEDRPQPQPYLDRREGQVQSSSTFEDAGRTMSSWISTRWLAGSTDTGQSKSKYPMLPGAFFQSAHYGHIGLLLEVKHVTSRFEVDA
ncbi:MAG: hypothetical protein Q9170_002494 [Blastenia crenularia]